MKHRRRLFAAQSLHKYILVGFSRKAVILLITAFISLPAVSCNSLKSTNIKKDSASNKTAKSASSIDITKTGQTEKTTTSISVKNGSSKKETNIEHVLYFADQKAESLQAEKRKVRSGTTQAIAEAIVEELLKGPKSQNLNAIIPADTRLLKVSVADTMITVDFSKEFTSKHAGGSAGETMTIYGIVNTLTELPGIDKVQILVEHQHIDTLAGHYDLRGPIKRDPSLVKAK